MNRPDIQIGEEVTWITDRNLDTYDCTFNNGRVKLSGSTILIQNGMCDENL